MRQDEKTRAHGMPDDAMEFLSAMIGSAKTAPVIVHEIDGIPREWVPDSVPKVGGTPPAPPQTGAVEEAPDLSGLGNYFASSSYAK